MNTNLKIFILLIILLIFTLILKRLKTKKISIKYGVFCCVLVLLLIIAVCFPNIFIDISNFLGFESATNMIFLLAFFFLFYLNFLLITNISILSDKVKLLIQEISILKERVDNDERKK